MRDLLKEFDNGVKVVKEWYSDDTGKPNENFIITLNDKDHKSYKSKNKAMDRAIALAARRNRKQ